MTRFKKIFIFLLAITFIGSVIYIYSSFKTVKAYTFTIPNINLNELNDKIKNTINKTESAISSFVGEKVQNTIDDSSKNLKQNTFEFIKKNMNNGIDVIGKTIGIDISTAQLKENQRIENNQNCR